MTTMNNQDLPNSKPSLKRKAKSTEAIFKPYRNRIIYYEDLTTPCFPDDFYKEDREDSPPQERDLLI